MNIDNRNSGTFQGNNIIIFLKLIFLLYNRYKSFINMTIAHSNAGWYNSNQDNTLLIILLHKYIININSNATPENIILNLFYLNYI